MDDFEAHVPDGVRPEAESHEGSDCDGAVLEPSMPEKSGDGDDHSLAV